MGFFPPGTKNLGANVAVLKQTGVPQYYITQHICTKSRVMKQDSDKFKNYVQEVLELEFQPSKSSFYQALCIIGGMRKLTWEHKKKIYKSWGWSDHKFLLAVKKHPICTSLSEKKIMSVMDFLANKTGFQSMAIARTPIVLCFCLEKRIVPRCKVMRVLQLKGLIKEDLSFYYFLQPSEKHFLDKFVIQYHQQVPQLLAVYQGKVGLVEIGIAPGNMLGIAKNHRMPIFQI